MMIEIRKKMDEWLIEHGILFSAIRHDTRREASINFGLTISLWRVEQYRTKKIVPVELHVCWHFWTWRNNTIFLFGAKKMFLGLPLGAWFLIVLCVLGCLFLFFGE